MRFLLTFLFLSTLAFAQVNRENRPLLTLTEEPDRILEENVMGWSISLDGQWYSGEQMIPLRTRSYQRDDVNDELMEVGLDNFIRWEFRTIQYNGKTLHVWMKIMHSGKFAYPETERGWDDIEICHYYVIDAEAMPDSLISATGYKLNVIPLLASGSVQFDDYDDVLEVIASEGQPSESHPYSLYIETFKADEEVRFQIYEGHSLFNEDRGLLNPITSNGLSVLGTERMFRIAYYACPVQSFTGSFQP